MQAVKNNLYLFLFLATAIPSTKIAAQSCGTDQVHQRMMQQDDYRRIYEAEQRSIYNRTTAEGPGQTARSGNFCGGIKTIPVVVHVMHTGESIGNGTNISDAQIQQAIVGTNTYWRNLNSLGAADMEIQFELAKRDPNGNATSGIVRVNASSVSGYASNGVALNSATCPAAAETDVKALSFWPVDAYYNIWIVNNICEGYAGFAYYPFGGWYDGAIVEAAYMNINSNTLAHELGHGFNLAHTFEGDNGGSTCPDNTDCLLNGDQVCDTPPHTVGDCDLSNNCSASGNWNFSRRNIMSYCFNDPMLFTPGQKTRAQLASEGSVRYPLLTSEALVPVSQPREAGIRSIESPGYLVCSSLFDPSLLVKNYGTQAISSIACNVTIDGTLVGQFSASASILPGQQGTLVLQDVPISLGVHQLRIEIASINGQPNDAYAGNNALCKEIRFAAIEALPFCETFETTVIPDYLTVIDSDNLSAWALGNGTGCTQTNGNKSIVYNGSQAASGSTTDELVLLPIDLSNTYSASLSFRIAEKQTLYCNTYVTLQVEASTDCGQTFTTLYSKNDAYTISTNCGGPGQCPCTQASSSPLHTTTGNFAPSESNPWVPASCNDWRNESINLNSYLNAESLILKFKATKAAWQSNNIYLDNLCVNVSYEPPATPLFASVGPFCTGSSIPALPTTSTNGITGTWSPAINNTATTTYTFTPTAGQFATTTQLTITINQPIAPAFASVTPYCAGSSIPALPTASTNGFTGAWSPAINNSTTTTYTFTPSAGQCATTAQLTIPINQPITPTFSASIPYCSGSEIPALPTTSVNDISGTWAPAINNTATTSYTFTPNSGQCAAPAQLTIDIFQPVVPSFSPVGPFCVGSTIPNLPLTSIDGISGTWLPEIDNTTSTTYSFTPNSNECATSTQLTITIDAPVSPEFEAIGPFCPGSEIPELPAVSVNEIAGTWFPVIDNQITTTYTFTPNPGECGTSAELTITIDSLVIPAFDAVETYCSGELIPNLPSISNNGVSGNWSPAINNTATTLYTFTPANGQCATATLTITVDSLMLPEFDPVGPFTEGATISSLPNTSLNGITGAWSPAINNMATTTYTFTPDAGQCADDAQLTITINPLSAQLISENPSAFLLLPNPTSGAFRLLGSLPFDETITYSIRSINGAELKSGTIASIKQEINANLSIADLACGVYILHLQTSMGVYTLKLVKQ